MVLPSIFAGSLRTLATPTDGAEEPPPTPNFYELRDNLQRRLNQNNNADSGLFLYRSSGLVLAAVALVAAAGFTVSARQQLHSVGLLGATGAAPRHIRAALTLHGLVVGTIGSAIGVCVGLIGALSVRTHVDGWTNRLNGPTVVSARELLTIGSLAVISATLAAAAPAFGVGRIPVRTALAGRRPLEPARVGFPILGVVITLMGCALLALAAIVGGAASPAGLVLWIPSFVALAGRLAGLLPRGLGRLAVRGVTRNRTRSRATIGAIMAICGASIGASAITGSSDARTATQYQPISPRDQVDIFANGEKGPVEPPAAFVAAIRKVLPAAAIARVQYIQVSVRDQALLQASFCATDEAGLRTLAGGAQLAEFRAGALIQVTRSSPLPVSILIPGVGGAKAVRIVQAGRTKAPPFLVMSHRHAARIRPPVDPTWHTVFVSPVPITDGQQRALNDIQHRSWYRHGSDGRNFGSISINFERQPTALYAGWQRAGFLAAVALTLAIVAISLALAASDGRDDEATLVAVGATPGTR